MAGQSWCININAVEGGGVSLNPDVWDVQPGAPLQAEVGDLVSWSNNTNDDHQIVIEGETFDAKPWKSTDAFEIQNPNAIPTPYTISYTCSTAEGDQTGLIDVTA